MIKTIKLQKSKYIVEINLSAVDYVQKLISDSIDIYSVFVRQQIGLCIRSFILPSVNGRKGYKVKSEEGKRKAIDSLKCNDYEELLNSILYH